MYINRFSLIKSVAPDINIDMYSRGSSSSPRRRLDINNLMIFTELMLCFPVFPLTDLSAVGNLITENI